VTNPKTLLARIQACKPGIVDWSEFASASRELLTHLLVPPLREPYAEYETTNLEGSDRRDIVFANRVVDPRDGPWGLLRLELAAKLIVVDFKNFSPDKDAVIKTLDYLRPAMGQLAIICCNGPPKKSAFIKRRERYHGSDGAVPLFLTIDNLLEMCDRKDAGEDPAELILDLYDRFLREL
jgi:hypothetical protein